VHFLLTGGTLNPLKETYQSALARYGHTAEVFYPGQGLPGCSRFDALLLPGGGDIHPGRFGRGLLENGSEALDVPRDGFELDTFYRFFGQGKPILGICRGIQVINIALGGDIWQDLPSQCGKYHCGQGSDALWHDAVWFNGQREHVNSYHHQAVRRLGNGLVAAAKSPDGVTEAICHSSKPVRAVQWHPELMGERAMEWLLSAGKRF